MALPRKPTRMATTCYYLHQTVTEEERDRMIEIMLEGEADTYNSEYLTGVIMSTRYIEDADTFLYRVMCNKTHKVARVYIQLNDGEETAA